VLSRIVPAMRSVAALGQAYADLVCETFPARATYLGVHDHDHRLGAHTAATFETFASAVRALRTELASTGDGGIEARALDGALATELLDLDHEQQWRRNPDAAIDGALGACVALLLRGTAPVETRLGALRDRLAALPEYLDGARRTWSDVPRVWSESAYETAIAGAAFLRDDLPGGLLDVATRAADALEDVAAHLRTLPDGGSWVAGERVVAQRLREQHRLSDGPETIAARGHALVTETLARLEELDPDWRSLVARHKDDHPPLDGLLARYRDEMARTRAFVEEHDVAGATPVPLDVRPSPRFWAHLVPYAAYDPPGFFEPGSPGVFWVTVPDGTDATERLRGHADASVVLTAIHEGYPGHHLQLTRANRDAGVVAAMADSPLTVEGWAFYCEEMLLDAGLHGDNGVMRAFQLKDQLWRAVRVVVDIGLHAGEITFDAAVDMLVSVADLERPNAIDEVRRYTSSPTYQICYAIGKDEILQLRERCATLDGPSFRLGRFHDELLSYGSLPVPLIAEAMLGAREPSQ
jgi:hypothetical protein